MKLLRPDAARDGRRRFLTTGNPEKFEGIARRLTRGFVDDAQQVFSALPFGA